MILETIRNWFGWRRKIPDPFPSAMKMTVNIPPGVRHVVYTVRGTGGAGGSSGGADPIGYGSGGGRDGDLIVVKYHGSTMWPADDDSG